MWVYEERRNGFAKKSKFKNKILVRIRANRFFLIPLHNLLTTMVNTVCDATYKNYQGGFCHNGIKVESKDSSCPVPAGYPNSQTAASHTSGCPLYNAIPTNIVSTPKVMSFGSTTMCGMSPYLATSSPNCPVSSK